MNVQFDTGEDFQVTLAEELQTSAVFEDDLSMDVAFEEDDGMDVQFGGDNAFEVTFGEGMAAGDYTGPYEVTPSQTAQTLPTEGKTLSGNIKVKAIPSNYGRITWNGSTLTVA